MKIWICTIWKTKGGNGLILSALVDILCYANSKCGTHISIFLAARTEQEISTRFTEYYGKPFLHYVNYDALKPVDFQVNADYIIHGASNAHPAALTKMITALSIF